MEKMRFCYLKGNTMKPTDLEERLLNFAVLIIEIVNEISNTIAGNHLSEQILRSGTSPALNYGEGQSAESKKDFIHKIGIVLKELRETFVCLKIIKKSKLFKSEEKMETALQEENNELISSALSSVKTAKKRPHIIIRSVYHPLSFLQQSAISNQQSTINNQNSINSGFAPSGDVKPLYICS